MRNVVRYFAASTGAGVSGVGVPADERQVDVIAQSADGLRDAFAFADDSGEISVQTFAPRGRGPRLAIFHPEDEAIVAAEMRGGRARLFPAPLPGRNLFFRGNPRVLPGANLHAGFQPAK